MALRLVLRITRASAGLKPRRGLSGGFHSLNTTNKDLSAKWTNSQADQLLGRSLHPSTTFQKLGFSSSATPQPNEKEAHQFEEDKTASENVSEETASEQPAGVESDLSKEDLVKLHAEKEELLKLKDKEIEEMKDKVLRTYAEMENVINRTRREAENSKKFAIQNFAKGLLDVSDNLGRASSVVKESFSKIDSSKDSVGAVPLLKTLLEGVEMTDKQLAEVLRKFGVEKFDPVNELFDPNRHYAVFQIPDASKPPGTVAAVIKTGYMIYDRVLRPAEVGVTDTPNDNTAEN